MLPGIDQQLFAKYKVRLHICPTFSVSFVRVNAGIMQRVRFPYYCLCCTVCYCSSVGTSYSMGHQLELIGAEQPLLCAFQNLLPEMRQCLGLPVPLTAKSSGTHPCKPHAGIPSGSLMYDRKLNVLAVCNARRAHSCLHPRHLVRSIIDYVSHTVSSAGLLQHSYSVFKLQCKPAGRCSLWTPQLCLSPKSEREMLRTTQAASKLKATHSAS